jgi:hypothetical protein
MLTLDREALDDAVRAMFREADTDRNGKATLAELHAIVAQQRAQIVAERFRAVDSDRNGAITVAEFDAWQQRLGTASREDSASLVYDYVPTPDVIGPPRGDSEEHRVLAMLIRPLNTHNLVSANVDYDEGVTLEELLRFERAPFDAADLNGDGKLSPDEIRALQVRRDCGPPGGAGMMPPGGPPVMDCARRPNASGPQ